jgi:rRNA-processing protein FCF1
MPDCCVLYSAEQHNATIATLDDKLAARADDLGLTVATDQP